MNDRKLEGLGSVLIGVAILLAVIAMIVIGVVARLIDLGCNDDCLARHDLAMQANMAYAAWAMVIVTSGTGVLLWLTLRATRAQIATSERIGEAQTRAYLTVTSASTTIGDGLFRVDYFFRNSGQTPAKEIGTYVKRYIQRNENGGWKTKYSSNWEYKARSDVPSQEKRDGYSDKGVIPDLALWGPTRFRAIAEIRFAYEDVFGNSWDETVRYAANLPTVVGPGEHTLYRQIKPKKSLTADNLD